MVEKEMSDIELKGLLKLLHPIPPNQDGTCPHIKWMGEDLVHCPGVGEWKCKIQEDRYGDLLYGGGYENLDYKPCSNPNHKRCSFYLDNSRKTSGS